MLDRKRALIVLGLLWLVTPSVGAFAAEALSPKYHTHAELSALIGRLEQEHPRSLQVESIGTSREGRAIWALRVACAGDVDPDRRPALLVVANVDGEHLVGSETTLKLVQGLLQRAAEGDEVVRRCLGHHTLYVLPRVNPDAAERCFATPRSEWRRTLRPDDQDRDGRMDEDGPNDLNGDGLITMMRVPEPDEADLMPDPEAPRLDVTPERDKGERATHTLYVEGLDDDGDGAFNEDPAGGVDLNMNFMHRYRAHADGVGPHQVSEPESRALVDYVLAHQNIAVVLTYGRHDTLSTPPDGKGRDDVGAPKNIDPGDVGVYAHLGSRFVELTGLKNVPSVASDGAFHAWAYAQFGVPSFATPLWTRPEPQGKTGDDGPAGVSGEATLTPDDDAGDATPSGIGDISQETLDELRAAAEAAGFEVTDAMVAQITPAEVEGFAKQMGIEVIRVKGAAAAGAGAAKNKDDAAWLAYSDGERDGSGFVDWEAFDHPQLGPVEIGGWAPGFRINPPVEALDGIADKQIEFVLDLAGRLPVVTLAAPEITRLASGLYEIETALVNDGYLPTGTAMAVRNRRARPYVVRLSAPVEQVLTGRRVSKVWSVPGSGGRETFRWIVRAAEGSELTITVYSEKFGTFDRTVWLRGPDPGAGGGAEDAANRPGAAAEGEAEGEDDGGDS